MRLRLIAGEFGGRLINAPDGTRTHPMGERIRSALFNILGDITGKTVLDPFAGTGALSFEALSRGAASALMLERDKKAQQVIVKNITTLGVDSRAHLVASNCRIWSLRNPHEKFDLLLVDPPYDDMQFSTVSLLTRHLNPNGLMVLSNQGRGSAPTVNGVVVVDKRDYGDAALAFYRPENRLE